MANWVQYVQRQASGPIYTCQKFNHLYSSKARCSVTHTDHSAVELMGVQTNTAAARCTLYLIACVKIASVVFACCFNETEKRLISVQCSVEQRTQIRDALI